MTAIRPNTTFREKEDLYELEARYRAAKTDEERDLIFKEMEGYRWEDEAERVQKEIFVREIREERLQASFHPIANIIPLMNEEEIVELARDIKKNGLNHPMVRYEGKILSGKNRRKALDKINQEGRYVDLPEGVDPLAFVISENLHRRNMNRYNSAVRCNMGLAILETERTNARERQEATHLDGKTKMNDPKFKSSVRDHGSPAEDHEKGRAIDITARKVRVSPTTLRKVIKITEIAKNDPNIARKWELAKKGKTSINAIYKEVTRSNDPGEIKREKIKKAIKYASKVIALLKDVTKDDRNGNLLNGLLLFREGKTYIMVETPSEKASDDSKTHDLAKNNPSKNNSSVRDHESPAEQTKKNSSVRVTESPTEQKNFDETLSGMSLESSTSTKKMEQEHN